jgi:hypothetical protein
MRALGIVGLVAMTGCGLSFQSDATGGAAPQPDTTSSAGAGGTTSAGGFGGTPSGGAGTTTVSTGGGGQGGMGGTADPCALVYEDGFDSLNGWDVETSSGGNVGATNGELVLSSGGDFGLVLSQQSYTHTSCGVMIEVVQGPNNQGILWLYMADVADIADRVTMVVSGTELQARYLVDGVLSVLGSVAYDPQQHRWWRIRRTAPAMLWEVSAEGVTWKHFHSEPVQVWGAGLNTIGIGIGVGFQSSQARLDNLRVLTDVR